MGCPSRLGLPGGVERRKGPVEHWDWDLVCRHLLNHIRDMFAGDDVPGDHCHVGGEAESDFVAVFQYGRAVEVDERGHVAPSSCFAAGMVRRIWSQVAVSPALIWSIVSTPSELVHGCRQLCW